MLQMKKQFADSFEELKNLRTIVVTALLIAIAVVLGFFSVQLTENLKIGFSFIANELTAMLFGPVYYQISAQTYRSVFLWVYIQCDTRSSDLWRDAL